MVSSRRQRLRRWYQRNARNRESPPLTGPDISRGKWWKCCLRRSRPSVARPTLATDGRRGGRQASAFVGEARESGGFHLYPLQTRKDRLSRAFLSHSLICLRDCQRIPVSTRSASAPSISMTRNVGGVTDNPPRKKRCFDGFSAFQLAGMPV